jgi:hypothetical protein
MQGNGHARGSERAGGAGRAGAGRRNLRHSRGKVFISYASADKAAADAIVAALERGGIRCWIAPRDVTPGLLYADAIVQALNSAPVTTSCDRPDKHSPDRMRAYDDQGIH